MRRAINWLSNPVNVAVIAFTLSPFLLLLIFLDAHSANLPRGDDFVRGMPVAIATIEGDLTLGKLLSANIGQVAVFTKLVTVILTLLTDWNVVIESYITVGFSVVSFVLLVWMITLYQQEVAPIVVIIAAVLYFSVHQNTNWYISHNSWFFPQLFFLLTLLTFYRMKPGWRAYLLALVLSVMGTYSHGNGVVVFPAMAVAMWVRGYRRWYWYVLWVAVGAISLYGYTQLAGVAVSATNVSEQASTEVSVVAPLASIRFALIILGSMFISHETQPAVIAGGISLVMLLVNSFAVWRIRGNLEEASVWLVASLYSLGTAALVGLTRFNTYPDGLAAALGSRYLTATTFMWIGIVAMGALVIYKAQENGWLRLVAVGNVLAACIGAALFGPSVIITLNRPYYDEQKDITEACYMRGLYIQETAPLFAEGCKPLMGLQMVNELSVYELAMFAQDDKVNILGERYQSGVPVLVEGDYGWVNYNIAKWLLAGIPADTIIHVMPEQPQSNYSYRDVTLPNAILEPNIDLIMNAVGDAEALWVVQRAEMETRIPEFWELLAEQDFVPTRFTYETPEGIAFTITRYQKLTIDVGTPINFDEQIQLVGYSSLDGRLASCGRVTVRSFWEPLVDDLVDGYSATMTLDRITGSSIWDFETIARVDSQLTLAPTDTWEVGELYLDERSLDIPCDLPPGEYVLRVGVYNYRDGQRLAPQAEGISFNAELNLADIERVELD